MPGLEDSKVLTELTEDDLEKVAGGAGQGKRGGNIQSGTYSVNCPFCNTPFSKTIVSEIRASLQNEIGVCSKLDCGAKVYFKNASWVVFVKDFNRSEIKVERSQL